MVTFSEQALAAYDLLVNKGHDFESEKSSVGVNGDTLNYSPEETYSPPWAPQLEVAGHRGGLVAGSARQAQVWNTLLGTLGSSQLSDAAMDHQEGKGSFKHSNIESFNERTSRLPNPENKDSKRTYEPWAWRSQMERLKEERKDLLMRGTGPRKSILKDGRSAWEVSKVPKQKRVKLLTPADKQTTL